jgi:hypothetical protein
LAAVLGLFALGTPAFAQTITVTNCARPTLGVVLGVSGNGDRNGAEGTYPNNHSGSARDVAMSFQVPVGIFKEVRAELGSVAWEFQSHDFQGVPLLRETIRIRRATFTVVKLERRHCSPIRLMAGLGVGAYSFQFDRTRITKGGLHGFAGIDVEVSDRAALTAEFAMHAIAGPDRTPVFSNVLFTGRAAIGVRVRF